MQSFKQFPYQNYIQLRFSSANRNLSSLHLQQLSSKYHRNSSILSKIFSLSRDPTPPSPPTQPIKTLQQQDSQTITLTRDLLARIQQQVQQEQRGGRIRVQELKMSRDMFTEFMAEAGKITTKEGMEEMMEKLKKVGLYDETHPYLVETSPFYMNTSNVQVLEVTKDGGREVGKEEGEEEKVEEGEEEFVYEELN